MNHLIRMGTLALMAGSLIACADMSNQDAGVITGAVVGGVLGNQVGKGSGRVVATTVGAIAGSMIGGAIGENMDRSDQANVARTLENTPTGQHYSWNNPDSGYHYEVTPTKTYYRKMSHGTQPCREYSTKAIIGGKTKQIYGKACRMDDGSWRVVR